MVQWHTTNLLKRINVDIVKNIYWVQWHTTNLLKRIRLREAISINK